MSDQRRNLDPHKAAIAAMWLYGAEYSGSGAGSMGFWDRLDNYKRRQCRGLVENIEGARPETAKERAK